jgi:hypothetical protein
MHMCLIHGEDPGPQTAIYTLRLEECFIYSIIISEHPLALERLSLHSSEITTLPPHC